MKNVIYLAIVCLAIGTTIVSCKEEDNGTAMEYPLKSFFEDTILSPTANNDTFIDDDDYYEFGFEFVVTKAGNVTHLGIHNPGAGNVRATLWDLTDTSVLAQKTITVAAHAPKYEALAAAVPLSVGKKYAVTMLSDDYYWRERNGGTAYPYPVTKGNVQITNYGYRNATSADPAIYPTGFYDDYLAGIVDIGYETEN